MPDLRPTFFRRDALACAERLIGADFRLNGCRGRIVETEAYRAKDDPACHTFFRRKARDFVAGHDAGAAYVYLNYGMHWLLNFLTKKGDNPGFVLIRAIQPLDGVETMRRRRANTADRNLCSGPGKLTRAFAIDGRHHGRTLVTEPGVRISLSPRRAPVLRDGRIGISRAADFPWRFTHAELQEWTSRKARPPA